MTEGTLPEQQGSPSDPDVEVIEEAATAVAEPAMIASDESRLLGAPDPAPSAPPPAAHSPNALQVNQLFGKYRVVRDLGAGGMAQVFLAAIDGPEGFQKQCVVKRILPEYARDPNFSQMFINEARVAAMMSHQNIVQVFEFSKENDEYFLAMEYVAGASLDRVIRTARKVNFPLGVRATVEVGIGIAHALGYAHTFSLSDGRPLRIVHRDVSPENILISREGAVKLTDFGVVRSAMNSQATVAGMVKGKWSYMSPEQVMSQPFDHRSDLFSLGIVLYELSTGKRLFRGDSIAATVAAVMRAEVTPPSKVTANFPAQLERIIMKLLERDPNQRYASGEAVAADLDAFRAQQPWTSSGQRHLASVVNTLFPKDGSQPGMTIMPISTGSGSEERGIAVADSAVLEQPMSSINVAVAPPESGGVTPTFALALTAVAVLLSAAFWFFLL